MREEIFLIDAIVSHYSAFWSCFFSIVCADKANLDDSDVRIYITQITAFFLSPASFEADNVCG